MNERASRPDRAFYVSLMLDDLPGVWMFVQISDRRRGDRVEYWRALILIPGALTTALVREVAELHLKWHGFEITELGWNTVREGRGEVAWVQPMPAFVEAELQELLLREVGVLS